MHKIDTENRTSADEFVDADESQGIAGTDLNAAWFNSVQRELCNAVTKGGLTLNSEDDSQIWQVLNKIGIFPFEVTGDTFTPSNSWNGSVILRYAAKDMTVNGQLLTGSVMIVLPAWSKSSADSYKFTYGTDTVYIKKGRGLFAFAMNGTDDVWLAASNFVMPVTGAGLVSDMATISGNVTAGGFVDNSIVIDSAAAGDNGEYRPWQLYKNWTDGQVKRVRSILLATKSYKINYYASGSGDLAELEFYPGSYREVMCVGSYTREDGLVYAVLVPNGLATTTEDA